jgi:hypothetical protein
MSSRCKAFILMMKAAELRDLNKGADTGDLAGKRALFVEAQMGPGSVVVLRHYSV